VGKGEGHWLYRVGPVFHPREVGLAEALKWQNAGGYRKRGVY